MEILMVDFILRCVQSSGNELYRCV